MEQKLEKAAASLLERQHLIQQLQSALTSVIAIPKEPVKNSLYTQTIDGEKTPSLILYFDHGIDPDPAFSGPCMARIYLDEDHQLKLAIWPPSEEKKLPIREQTLLKDVKTFTFRFLKKQKTGALDWEKERSLEDTSPIGSILYLDLWQGEEPLTFAFLLPFKEPSILYSSREKKL